MYSSRGNSSYGHQPYAPQSSYGQQNQATGAYSGTSTAGQDNSSSQLSIGSRHPSILGGPHESEVGGRQPSAYSSATAPYSGQYSSLYASASLGSGQQVSALSAKGSVPAGLEGRNYSSVKQDSPKYPSIDYVSSSNHGYTLKAERGMPDQIADYGSLDRRQFSERQGAYGGRDLPLDAGGRYGDPGGYTHQHKSELYDRIDQAPLLRQDHMLKSQSLQPAPIEITRQADYLAVRSGTYHHATQELASYGGRVDADPRIPAVGNSSYAGQSAPSILGAAPQRSVDDRLYAQASSNPGYGVSLPPGRDYGTAKGLHGTSLDPDFPGIISSRGGHSRLDDVKDDGYARELEREKDREEDRRRERLRDREREREKDREKERERRRERDRERRRLSDLRDKDRERKRTLEGRRDRTPPRASLDRRGSSMTKDGKSSRRDSPRREALHRIHSPAKRRDYVCKVYASSLVDVEKDYLSLDKRYPRLYISPYFSKVVVNWPKENLNLHMHTPVSFEHDFVEDGVVVLKSPSTTQAGMESANIEHTGTVWNAKMILMSGLSRSAVAELSSEKFSDDRVPHICNFLRFAVLKKDRSIMAIGGPWDAVDGGDPAVDDSSLVQTILRYAKDLTHLDLQNCKHWNRFLEIHYDRVGKDGLFSHKEVTVLFVPDLSDCLPSLNAWRDQWFAHKKVIADRFALLKEKSRDKKDAPKETSSPKDTKAKKAGKKKEIEGSEQKAGTTGKDVEKNPRSTVKKKVEQPEEADVIVKKEEVGNSSTPTQASGKTVKKKVVKKIVKQKVADKKVSGENGGDDEKTVVESSGMQEMSSADAATVKTFTRKKIAKQVSGTDIVMKDAELESNLKSDDQPESEDKSEVKSGAPSATAVPGGPVKRMVKRKIIKRVPKKKAIGVETNDETSDKKAGTSVEDVKMVEAGNETDNAGDAKASVGDKSANVASKKQSGVNSSKKVETVALVSKPGNKVDVAEKEAEKPDDKQVSGTKKVSNKDKHDDNKKSKDAERKKSEEPPRHPGFIMKTKCSKDAKLRSLSMSLESLLGYSDKDIEEPTFELSIFAESFFEMLQHQMGCRVLSFLQKLRIKFITKRFKRKRQREQTAEKQRKEKEAKRVKTEESSKEEKPVKIEPKDEHNSNAEKLIVKEENAAGGAENLKEENEEPIKIKVEGEEEMSEDEISEEEDPEEDPEEDEGEDEEEEEDEEAEEELADGSPQQESSKKNSEEGKTNSGQGQIQGDGQDAKEKTAKEKVSDKKKPDNDVEAPKPKEVEADSSKKTSLAPKEVPVNKELLQAFRFFDRNCAGYLRVEDLRMIIHNLGKFISHRDVKELVQSALLESNTGRDDRVLYEKLVRMSIEL